MDRILIALTAAALAGSAVAAADMPPPTDAAALYPYLKEGSYRAWASESAPHASAGPHPVTVRTWLNPALRESLAAGRREHPEGATAVKELYGADGRLSGWAVSVKAEAQSRIGQGWYWYEVTSPEPGARPVAAGRGVALCAGCHLTGHDFVLTPFPLR